MSNARNVLPDTADEQSLLREFLAADIDLLLLADNHILHIRQLIAWIDSEPVQKILADLERLAEIRTRGILAQARSAAATRAPLPSLPRTPTAPPRSTDAPRSARSWPGATATPRRTRTSPTASTTAR